MIHINEYQEFRRLKKKLRRFGILKPLKYKADDYVVLKNGKKGTIIGINKYNLNPKKYIGNNKKDYYFLEDKESNNDLLVAIARKLNTSGLLNQTTIDESEIDQKESEFYSNIKKYNL